MNEQPDSHHAEITTTQLDELRQLGDELRGLFAHERRAIAKLDHEKMTWLAEQKRAVAQRLSTARAALGKQTMPREIRELFLAIQAEARATAMLANTAAEAVRSLLGYEQPSNSYDRRARATSARPMLRTLMTY